MKRFTLSRFSCLGTLQSRHGAIEGAEGTIAATRDPLVAAARHVAVEGVGGTIAATRDPLVAADRIAEVEVMEGALDAQAYLVAAPSYLVPGARRFGLSRFSIPGTLQSRHMAVEGAEGTIAATRDPLVAAARHAEVDALGGYLAGRSYAVPDVSGGVSIAFEEVYPI